jgi:hypothetical protein
MSEVILYVPPGTVCIECSVGDEVAADAVFQIDNTDIKGRIGRVVDGVLVVFDTESVFTTSSTTDVQCTSLTVSHQVVMYLESFRPPVITGNTTLSKGDTLYLDCDTSNSNPRVGLSVKWLSPEGVVVSYDTTLEIMNIQRSAVGIYTCVATRPLSGATMNSTVNVTVQFPCETLQSTTDIIVNLTSTAMGSTATYQCRNGSSDVYTTQCTSDGVWEPNPNSTLDCTPPVLCETLQSTENIIVNFTSTV